MLQAGRPGACEGTCIELAKCEPCNCHPEALVLGGANRHRLCFWAVPRGLRA